MQRQERSIWNTSLNTTFYNYGAGVAPDNYLFERVGFDDITFRGQEIIQSSAAVRHSPRPRP